MAWLRAPGGGVAPLAARTLCGRGPACVLRLDGHLASREHAVLTWTPDGVWELRDLGSRNGTFADGVRLAPGEGRVVLAGSVLGFGDVRERWLFENDDPPGMMVVDVASGELRQVSGGLLALPTEERPLVTIYEAPDGRWVQHAVDREPVLLDEGSTITVGDRSYLVLLPAGMEGTPIANEQPLLAEIDLELAPSMDQENVDVVVFHHGTRRVLGAREHGYLMLLLAQRRIEDAELPSSEQGWIDRDELLRMLRCTAPALDLLVHRARKQLGEAGVRGAAGIIEVRRGARRLGTPRVTITGA
ncbi:FHA domain-containing protein [Myxococcota bacterium]|nr:FHA domain-containing protein [Myxococcota bacterium]